MGFSRQEYWSRLPFPSPTLRAGMKLLLPVLFDHQSMCRSSAEFWLYAVLWFSFHWTFLDQAENLLQNRINSVFFFFFLVISENEENTLYVVACNPVSLYFMNMTGKSGHFVDLFDIFPRTASGIWHPFVTVAPLGTPLKGQVVLHEQQVTAWPPYVRDRQECFPACHWKCVLS